MDTHLPLITRPDRESSDSLAGSACPCTVCDEAAGVTIGTMVLRFSSRFGLSPAETSVVHFAAHGLSSKQIADARGSSAKTVETLWARIYRKVRMPSQRDVLAALLKQAIEAISWSSGTA